MNESIAFKGRKLKRNSLINAYYPRNRVLHIKELEQSRPIRIYHISKLANSFPNASLCDDKAKTMKTYFMMHHRMQTNPLFK